MWGPKTWMLLINVIGGVCILGGYVQGLMSHPHNRHLLWGGVPEAYRGVYTFMMFPAAIGYLCALWVLWRHLMPGEVQILGTDSINYFNVCFVFFLVSAAAWMPLTLAYLDHGSASLLPWVFGVLAVTAVFSLGLLWGVSQLGTHLTLIQYRMAWVGLCALCIQTVMLDALVWIRLFPGSGA